MNPGQFIPIKIKKPTSSDRKRILQGSISKDSYTIIFPFSSKPPHGWDRMFREILDSREGQSTDNPKPQAFVHEQELRIICSLDEIPSYFKSLKEAVEKTNERYLQSLKQRVVDEETRVRNEDVLKSPEERAIDEALDTLDYS